MEGSQWTECARQDCNVLLEYIGSITSSSAELSIRVYHALSKFLSSQLGWKCIMVGSLPMGTHLPDSDVDVCVVPNYDRHASFHGNEHDKHPLQRLLRMLRTLREIPSSDERDDQKYSVHWAYIIWATVPVLKCAVEGVTFDFSCHTGGVTTMHFLEEVGNTVGSDQLFKRSVLLAKIWAYYEARILGSHNGMLSTYAVAITMLHVFLGNNSSNISHPLDAFMRWLSELDAFNWRESAMNVSSRNGTNCAVSSSIIEQWSKLRLDRPPPHASFAWKRLNIVDPLRPWNNVGQSVSSANDLRIRSAIRRGKLQFEELKQLTSASSGETSIFPFFSNSLKLVSFVDRQSSAATMDTNSNERPCLLPWKKVVQLVRYSGNRRKFSKKFARTTQKDSAGGGAAAK